MRPSPLNLGLVLVLVFGPSLARATDKPLPLHPGTYVIASYKPCQEAPLAGVSRFNGFSFEGPHASNCQTTVLRRRGSTYRIKTTCSAMGNGSPAVPSGSVQDIHIKSSSSFSVGNGKQRTEYRQCPAFR
jgi:hypothetical protein